MAIKAVIFDCFGVLVMTRRGVLLNDYPQLKESYKSIESRVNLGELSHQGFNELISELTGSSVVEIEKRYWATNRINKSLIDWISDLQSSGQFKIGLLSNVNRDLMNEYLALFKKEKLFDDIVLSSDVGLAKPDPKIFELAVKRLGLKADECVMVDDRSVNIESAKSIGIHGIIFLSNDQVKADLMKLLELPSA